ncbi:hypothetical protein FF098_005165 [Parvularcula flava]|uniref:Uncharacterized protein n=1 Tax=Aquisalinus luteolus TaxID=1566827 RepID=A0ABX0HKU6_9PROT|nr:hypothetical protein [Aquisalinus luteolus]NHK27287.1 hypothetical protein [Aquisalinus luteolus]
MLLIAIIAGIVIAAIIAAVLLSSGGKKHVERQLADGRGPHVEIGLTVAHRMLVLQGGEAVSLAPGIMEVVGKELFGDRYEPQLGAEAMKGVANDADRFDSYISVMSAAAKEISTDEHKQEWLIAGHLALMLTPGDDIEGLLALKKISEKIWDDPVTGQQKVLSTSERAGQLKDAIVSRLEQEAAQTA